MDMLLQNPPSESDDTDACKVECSCCPFRNRRTSLIKKLWRLRVTNHNTDTTTDIDLKSLTYSVLKRLKERQLHDLTNSVSTKGANMSSCVLLPRSDLRLGRRSVSPQIMMCKLWRWADVDDGCELKQLPQCGTQGAGGSMYVCCNPYHCSRVAKDVGEPPTSDLEPNKDVLTHREEITDSGHASTETGLTPSCLRTSESGAVPCWLRIAYWEHRDRIGPLFPVHDPYIHVFTFLPHCTGFCLSLIQPPTKDNRVNRTREKIGFGVTLCREADNPDIVYIHNLSDYSIFVNSPILDKNPYSSVNVFEVRSGYCVKIFDFSRSRDLVSCGKYVHTADGPCDVDSVRVSFGKGWGRGYSRQFVISCPCWLELLLNVDR